MTEEQVKTLKQEHFRRANHIVQATYQSTELIKDESNHAEVDSALSFQRNTLLLAQLHLEIIDKLDDPDIMRMPYSGEIEP